MPESHVAYFRKSWDTASQAANAVVQAVTEALDAVINSRRWWLHFESDRVSRDEEQRKADAQRREDQEQRIHLRNQLLRLLETVHRLEPDEAGGFLSFGASDRRFGKVAERENNKIIAEASKTRSAGTTKTSDTRFWTERLYRRSTPSVIRRRAHKPWATRSKPRTHFSTTKPTVCRCAGVRPFRRDKTQSRRGRPGCSTSKPRTSHFLRPEKARRVGFRRSDWTKEAKCSWN